MSRLNLLHNGSLQIHAPAKLNLGLRVYPPRPDGFHDIESWFVPLSWRDTLTISPNEKLEFSITGRREGIPLEHHKNLITRAALLLASHAGIQPKTHIHLHKVLPPGGGLGGGSSDAASALLALNYLWELNLPHQVLAQLAAQLGSDVPFFLTAKPALCTGRGDVVTPLPPPPGQNLFTLLLIPPQGCPTKEVFQAFDTMLPEFAPPRIDWQRLATLPANQLNHLLQNDLAPAAYRIAPWLAQLQQQAEHILNQPVHLTGSGSTLFTLTDSSLRATLLQSRLAASLDTSITLIPAQITL